MTSQHKSERRDDAVSGNILVDSGAWGSSERFSERLTLIERAVNEREALEINRYTYRKDASRHSPPSARLQAEYLVRLCLLPYAQ